MGRIPTIFYCPYENCNASYNREDRYKTHIRSHTGERPYVCSYEDCGKNFASSSHLKRHEDTHELSFRCTMENCLAVLKSKATLKKHIKIVHLKQKGHKTYTCTQCGKDFNKHKTLQWHEQRHAGRFPHVCSVEDCQKAFLTPSKLKRHMKIHNGYPCKIPQCGIVLENWSTYVKHMRECHPPEYKCQVCSKVFSKSNALKSHTLIHEESRLAYPCEVPDCARYYFAKRNLDWHMRKYHAKFIFSCKKENCQRAFKTEAELADHILYHGKKKLKKKKKPKKHKPSLAAKLSGFPEVKEVNPEPDISASSELNQSSVLKETSPCVSTNENDVSSSKSFESSQSNIPLDTNIFNYDDSDGSFMELEVVLKCQENNFEYKSITEHKSDSLCFSENNIVPMECDTRNSLINVEAPEESVQECATVEVVDNENRSQIMSVPIIKIDNKHWNETIPFRIETVF